MPNGTFFQSAPSPPLVNATRNSTTTTLPQSAAAAESSSDPSTNLAEAIDDFLGDLEKKFRGISDEILTKCESSERTIFDAWSCAGLVTTQTLY